MISPQPRNHRLQMSESTPNPGIKERIDEVAAELGWSLAEWSRKAGLKSQGHISQIRRGTLKGNSGVQTFAAIARAAGINEEWLRSGQGPKKGSGAARYPNLQIVVDYWRVRDPNRWSPATIDAGKSMANHAPADLSIEEWEERLDSLQVVMTGKSPLPEPEQDGPVPPRSRKKKP